MSSSPKSAEFPVAAKPEERAGTGPVILFADGGRPFRPPPAGDPYAEWLDLMEVVEALCPRWPPRRPHAIGSQYKL